MNKLKIKQLISFMLIIGCSFSFISCKKSANANKIKYTDNLKSYSVNKISDEDGFKNVKKLSDNSFIVTRVLDDSENVYITDITFSHFKELDFINNCEDILYYYCTSDNTGNGYVMTQNKSEKNDFVVYVFSQDGQLNETYTINELSELALENDFFYINDIVVDSNGKMFFTTWDKAYSFDHKTGIFKDVTALPKGVNYFLQADKLFCINYSNGKISTYSVNDENTFINENITCEGTLITTPSFNKNNHKVCMPLLQGVELLTDDGSISKELNWNEIGISSSEISCCIQGNEDDYYILMKSGDLYRLTEADSSTSTKKEISLLLLDKNYSFEQIASDFNKSQDEYYIKCFEVEGEDTEKSNEVNLMISSGKCPDIFVSDDTSYFYNLTQKGLFTDLYQLMDDDLNKSSFVPNVLEMSEYKEKLYTIPFSFSVMTFAANKNTGLNENLSFDELKSYYSSHEDINLMSTIEDKSTIFNLFRYSLDDFIDYSNKKCNFDSPEFISELEFCSKFHDIIDQSNSEYDPLIERAAFLSGNTLIKQMHIDNLRILATVKNNFFNNDDIVLVGIPSGTKNGACAFFNDVVGISKSCKEKEGAWKFFKYIFLNEHQEIYYNKSSMSTVENIFEEQCTDTGKSPHYYDNEGNKIYDDSPQTPIIEGNEVNIQNLTDEEIKRMSDYIHSVNRRFIDSSYVDKIVMEEVYSFFYNEITLEQCTANIQSRVSLLLSEQY